MPKDALKPVDFEPFVNPPSVFEVVDPRVDLSTLIMLRLAEKAGMFDRLPRRNVEMMVEYITAPITLKELGGYYGIREAGAQQIVKRLLYEISGNLRHQPSLVPGDFTWRPIGSVKSSGHRKL